MTLHLRICGAISYRLSRRHPTVCLIAAFIITITIILQLYAYRQHYSLYSQQRIGDFEYQPGAFLRGRRPSKNITYCEFNYGLPDKLDWHKIQVYYPPETGAKSSYRVIYNIIQGTAYANETKYNAVTYATQATPEFLYNIVEIARYWDGPISLAVYVPSYDLGITIQILDHLCHCYSGMAKVSVHIFYPTGYMPKLKIINVDNATERLPTATTVSYEEILTKRKEKYRSLDNKTRYDYIQWVRQNKAKRMMSVLTEERLKAQRLIFEDCSYSVSSQIVSYRQDHNMIYPINVGRNVARNASKTNYFLVSDIELVPSDGLAPKFLKMVRQLMGDKKREEGCIFSKSVFVVPLFEVEKGERIPRDKDTLINLINTKRAVYFHQKTCPHCQRFPGLQAWIARPAPKGVEPMLIGRREYPYHRWEPLYFGTHKEPWYSEMLTWEGRQDKMTQMLELCLQEYRMVVIDGGFLSHAAVSKTAPRHNRAERINARRYYHIIDNLKKRYRNKPQCKVK